MYESKLFRYVEKITDDEWKALRNFLKGSAGERNDPYRLFEYIYPYRTRLDHKKLIIDHVNENVFPHLSKKSVQNVMSILTKEIEHFWVWFDLQKSSTDYQLIRLSVLNRRGIYNEATNAINKNILENKNATLGLWDDYYAIRSCHEIFFSNNPFKSNSKGKILLFEEAIQSTKRFANNLLEYYKAEIYNQIHLHGEDWADILNSLKQIEDIKESNDLNEILQTQSELVKNDYEKDPSELLNRFTRDVRLFSEDIQLTLYFRLRRSLILNIRRGNENMTGDLVNLIMESSVVKPILLNNEISIDRFLGDVNVLSSTGHYVELQKYILNTSKFLNKRIRTDGIALGNLILQFALKNFDGVIEIFSKNKCSIPKHQLQLYDYFIRAYYELYGSDLSISEYYLRNYQDYIQRNKKDLSLMQVSSRKNFIKIFRNLLKRGDREKLIGQLKESDHVLHRKWLREKILADH